MKFLTLYLALLSTTVFGQHHSTDHNATPALEFQSVLTQILSDPELKAYKMESSVMTIKPGGIDTVSHRHDCELFGYVLEGAVEIALVTKTPRTYKAGEMFYEKRNVLHTLTHNKNSTVARVLLIFIIKEGRQGYTRAYDDQ